VRACQLKSTSVCVDPEIPRSYDRRMMSLLLEHARGEIKSRRLELGWTQEQLAHHAKVHVNTVKNVEGGKHQATVLAIEKIAMALGCHPRELLFPSSLELNRPATGNGAKA